MEDRIGIIQFVIKLIRKIVRISTSLPLFLTLMLLLSIPPANANNDTVHFNFDGTVIDKITYEIIVYEREKALAKLLENGYDIRHDVWKDPIKLRNKRIKQWREFRKHHARYSIRQHSGN